MPYVPCPMIIVQAPEWGESGTKSFATGTPHHSHPSNVTVHGSGPHTPYHVFIWGKNHFGYTPDLGLFYVLRAKAVNIHGALQCLLSLNHATQQKYFFHPFRHSTLLSGSHSALGKRDIFLWVILSGPDSNSSKVT